MSPSPAAFRSGPHRARRAVAAALLLAACAAVPARAERVTFGGQYRYWAFSNRNDLRDVLFHASTPRWHAQAELWDFVRGDDHFRPELGLHFRDPRRSVYTVQWRHETNQERFTLATEQIASDHWVARGEISPIVAEDRRAQTVLAAGGDYYWGSYNFLGATAIRDPRDDAFWTFPVRLRLANESNDWLQLTWAPATERTYGWAIDLKRGLLRLGVERNSRYDFTSLDNTVYTIGFQADRPAE